MHVGFTNAHNSAFSWRRQFLTEIASLSIIQLFNWINLSYSYVLEH